MAELVFKDPYVSIGGTVLSDHVRSVTIRYGAEIKDRTAGGNVGAGGVKAREKIAGLVDWSMDIEFNQDYAAGEVDATLFPLVGAAEFAVVVKPDGSVTSATNPSYTGNGVIESYEPIAGTVGEPVTAPVTVSGSGILQRATE